MQKGVEEIIRVFRRKVAQKLTTDRGAMLVPKSKQVTETNDFELITWLVIK